MNSIGLEFVMPIASRLPRLLIILALGSLSGHTLAMSGYNPAKPASKSASQPAVGASEYPYSQDIPSAKASETATLADQPDDASSIETQDQALNVTGDAGSRHKGACASGDHNSLQKSLLLTAFPRLSPITSSAGDLAEADYLLPQLLGNQLTAKHNAITPVQLPEALPPAEFSSEQLLSQQTQQLARRQHTQLVLSGEIVDMGMANPSATYNPGLYRRFMNGIYDLLPIKTRFDKRERLFSFRVNLRDGFTGQSLFSKTYGTYGIWGLTGNIGFGTPKFWESDYGDQVKSLIAKAASEVGDVVQCQPFIALVDTRPGQSQLLLQGGANNGLRAGDTLTLYQLVVQGSENNYDQHNTRLVNRNTAIQLSEVYPSHSVGVISGTTYLTGQFLAVAP
jgi:hypothetical protein